MEGYEENKQEIDIGKTPRGFYLDINGERLLTTEFLKEIEDRLDLELKKAFNIPEQKKRGFFGKR